ncbi:hypothetical protein FH972_026587 [Carpinus fangiana]|uniref:Uncharacterized protein n=1 Tax=Carpinus fangiana TaxID=176857 RepID=A0A5N6L4G4_9ROSI|nr:hypothetical protein FH972_026587 [Carpinus fangiana]
MSSTPCHHACNFAPNFPVFVASNSYAPIDPHCKYDTAVAEAQIRPEMKACCFNQTVIWTHDKPGINKPELGGCRQYCAMPSEYIPTNKTSVSRDQTPEHRFRQCFKHHTHLIDLMHVDACNMPKYPNAAPKLRTGNTWQLGLLLFFFWNLLMAPAASFVVRPPVINTTVLNSFCGNEIYVLQETPPREFPVGHVLRPRLHSSVGCSNDTATGTTHRRKNKLCGSGHKHGCTVTFSMPSLFNVAYKLGDGAAALALLPLAAITYAAYLVIEAQGAAILHLCIGATLHAVEQQAHTQGTAIARDTFTEALLAHAMLEGALGDEFVLRDVAIVLRQAHDKAKVDLGVRVDAGGAELDDVAGTLVFAVLARDVLACFIGSGARGCVSMVSRVHGLCKLMGQGWQRVRCERRDAGRREQEAMQAARKVHGNARASSVCSA